MRVLVITNLFPAPGEPHRGLFNLRQLTALSRRDDIRVVCPLPRLPGTGRVHDTRTDTVSGIAAAYPRYPYLPKIGQLVHDRLYERGSRAAVDEAVRAFAPDVVYATWSYPDVVAAARMARRHGLPLVARVHGTDINDYFRRARRRRLVVEALQGADAVVAVSSALADRLGAAGVASPVHVIPNGVDTARFQPRDRDQARRALGVAVETAVVLFVGNLKPVKNVEGLIRAVREVCRSRPHVMLVVVGDGPLRGRLGRQAAKDGLQVRVRFAGSLPPEEVARWMNAADVLCLPSREEGMPNVLLEAAASGLPVVASRAGGIPEVVREGATGLLVPPGDSPALAAAIAKVLSGTWSPGAIRAAAGTISWDENAGRLHGVLAAATRRGRAE